MEPGEVACAFAREVIAPNAARWEEERRYPREAFPEAAARGLCGLVVPVEMGGAGLGAAAMARVMEELAGADMAFSFGLVVHNNLAGAIARHGDPRHVETYLDDLIAGRRVGAFLLTEPRGGSDAGAILTRARRESGGWVIDGEKAWVSNGAGADVLSVYAQTDPALGWRGIACFLVQAGQPGWCASPPTASWAAMHLAREPFGSKAAGSARKHSSSAPATASRRPWPASIWRVSTPPPCAAV